MKTVKNHRGSSTVGRPGAARGRGEGPLDLRFTAPDAILSRARRDFIVRDRYFKGVFFRKREDTMKQSSPLRV